MRCTNLKSGTNTSNIKWEQTKRHMQNLCARLAIFPVCYNQFFFLFVWISLSFLFGVLLQEMNFSLRVGTYISPFYFDSYNLYTFFFLFFCDIWWKKHIPSISVICFFFPDQLNQCFFFLSPSPTHQLNFEIGTWSPPKFFNTSPLSIQFNITI